MRRLPSRKIRPRLLDLESRITPTHNLTVAAGATVNVSSATLGTITTFVGTGAGATLNPADIVAQLVAGHDVVIKTTGDITDVGLEDGTITWTSNLDLSNSSLNSNRMVMLDTTGSANPSAASMTVASGVTLGGADNSNTSYVGFDLVTPGATINLTGATIANARELTVNAGAGDFTFDNISLVGDADITAGTIHAAGAGTLDSTGPGASITLNGELVASVPTTITQDGGGTLILGGGTAVNAVTGTDGLSLGAGTISILKPVHLTAGAAQTLTFNTGAVSFGANAISADTISVGDGSLGADANFAAGTGTVTANVTVNSNGNLTPGGVGTVGTLNIVGNVTINDGGTYDPDFGSPASDVLAITGNLNLNAGAWLGNASAGALTAAADIVTLTGTVGGSVKMFANALSGDAAIVGDSVIKVTNYATAPAGVITVVPVTAGPATFSGHDADGTAYTVKLTGPGKLIVVPDAGFPTILVSDTTAASGLVISTKANGSDAILAASRISVTGLAGSAMALGALTARTTDVYDRLGITGGSAKSLTLRDAIGPVTIDGTAANNTTLKVRDLGDVTSHSALSSLTVAGVLSGSLTAPKMGAVTIADALPFQQFPSLEATSGGIGSVNIKGFFSLLDITATGPLGSLSARNLSGDINVGSVGPVKIAGSFDGNLTSAGSVGAITAGNLSGTFVGASFGAIKVANAFDGSLTTNANGTGAVASITAGEIGDSFSSVGAELSAKSFGAIKVTLGSFVGILTADKAVASITVAQDFEGSLTADSVGPVKVGGFLGDDLGDPFSQWQVTNGVASITAGSVDIFTFNARFLGSLNVIGNAARDMGADVRRAVFTLTGNNLANSPLNPAGFGIKTINVAGNVLDSDFFLRKGSLMSFKAARFVHSGLYLDYTPGAGALDQFDTAGAFILGTSFKLGSFTTTAAPLGLAGNPLNFAFSDSEIAADTIGTVKLSGVGFTNPGVSFGLKFHTAGGSVKVAAGLAANLLNTNLTPTLLSAHTPVQDDFFFISI